MIEAIIPTGAKTPILLITMGAVKVWAPIEAEKLPNILGGIFPFKISNTALPKMRIPAKAPYESIKPRLRASSGFTAI